jgi:hypothetical protein
VFRFALPEGHASGLPVASCVVAKHTPAEGKPIIRPYTPVSEEEVRSIVVHKKLCHLKAKLVIV